MKLKEKILLFITIGIILLVIIFSEIPSKYPPPKVIFVDIGEQGAFCRANIITEDGIIQGKPLYEIMNITDYFPPEVYFDTENKGYYKLETGLTKRDEIFEIRVACMITQPTVGIIQIIFNNTDITNMLCFIRYKEDYLVCIR